MIDVRGPKGSPGVDPLALGADATSAVDILEGARRGSRDPDIQLTLILAALTVTDVVEIQTVLASLVVDADPD